MQNIAGLQLAFEDLKKVLKECDGQKLNTIIADDYRGISIYGTTETKENIIGTFKPEMMDITEYLIEEAQYEVFGEIGIVSGRGNIAGSYNGYGFRHKVVFTDIFKFTKTGWIYFKSQSTEIKSA